MSKDIYRSPQLTSGYTGDEEEPASGNQKGPAPTTGDEAAADNRGTAAPSIGSGGAVGSGAGAGGGGSEEDYDSDPQGGGGAARMKKARVAPDRGADSTTGGSH